jgi:hypothetical protein
MWLRRLLAVAYALDEVSAHAPREVDWDALPERCALQLHWRHTPDFADLLRRHRFSVAALVRHPLDVLVSILQFAPHEPDTARWLDGEGGDESSILGIDPSSPEFLDYATGPRARALLSVTPEWLPHANATVHYTDLVSDTAGSLAAIARALDEPARLSPATVAASVTFEDLKMEAGNNHFWQGRPGLWREVLPDDATRAIVHAQPSIVELGFTADPVGVSAEQARRRWAELASAVAT